MVFGYPGALQYEYLGYWLRRINQKERIINWVKADIVNFFVDSATSHYVDK